MKRVILIGVLTLMLGCSIFRKTNKKELEEQSTHVQITEAKNVDTGLFKNYARIRLRVPKGFDLSERKVLNELLNFGQQDLSNTVKDLQQKTSHLPGQKNGPKVLDTGSDRLELDMEFYGEERNGRSEHIKNIDSLSNAKKEVSKQTTSNNIGGWMIGGVFLVIIILMLFKK